MQHIGTSSRIADSGQGVRVGVTLQPFERPQHRQPVNRAAVIASIFVQEAR